MPRIWALVVQCPAACVLSVVLGHWKLAALSLLETQHRCALQPVGTVALPVAADIGSVEYIMYMHLQPLSETDPAQHINAKRGDSCWLGTALMA